jgi:hypothetical protein
MFFQNDTPLLPYHCAILETLEGRVIPLRVREICATKTKEQYENEQSMTKWSAELVMKDGQFWCFQQTGKIEGANPIVK